MSDLRRACAFEAGAGLLLRMFGVSIAGPRIVKAMRHRAGTSHSLLAIRPKMGFKR